MKLKGIMPVWATSVDAQQSVDEEALCAFNEKLIDTGEHSLSAWGINGDGEFVMFSKFGRRRITELKIDAIAAEGASLPVPECSSTQKMIGTNKKTTNHGVATLPLITPHLNAFGLQALNSLSKSIDKSIDDGVEPADLALQRSGQARHAQRYSCRRRRVGTCGSKVSRTPTAISTPWARCVTTAVMAATPAVHLTRPLTITPPACSPSVAKNQEPT